MYALLWLNSDLHMINYVLFLATWAFNYNGKLAAHLTCCNSRLRCAAGFTRDSGVLQASLATCNLAQCLTHPRSHFATAKDPLTVPVHRPAEAVRRARHHRARHQGSGPRGHHRPNSPRGQNRCPRGRWPSRRCGPPTAAS